MIVQTVMVSNSTKINNTNNQLSRLKSLNTKNQDIMALNILVLDWDRHNDVAYYIQ